MKTKPPKKPPKPRLPIHTAAVVSDRMRTKSRKPSPARLDREIAEALAKSAYFKIGDVVLMGKYKNKRGVIVSFGGDKWGNPTVEIEPIPKGRKQNKIIGLYKIWRADAKAGVLKRSRSSNKNLKGAK